MTITDSPHLKEPKILILGDLLIDETWITETNKLSPEAPIPIATLIYKDPVKTLGGAGLAATYAKKYNIPSIFMSEISPEAEEILNKTGIKYISTRKINNNIKKIRYIENQSKYHLLRVDTDKVDKSSKFPDELILDKIQDCIKYNNIKCICMLNYRKGIFESADLCRNIIKLAKKNNIATFSDTRGKITKFSQVNTAKLNHKELKEAFRITRTLSPVELLQSTGIGTLLITRASEGAEAHSEEEYFKSKPRQLIGNPDVTGAGDVFDINFCYHYYCMTNKESLEESLAYATNKATEFIREPIETRLC